MKKLSSGEELFAQHCQAFKLEPVREYVFAPPRKWRADFFFAPNLIVEIEGGAWTSGRHVRGGGFGEDIAKYNAATLAGFRVLRFTTEMVVSGMAIDQTREALNGRSTQG